MMVFETFESLWQINDRYEDEEFEIKGDFISFEKLIKIIISFMNGKNEGGHMIIGIPETNEKPDFRSPTTMGVRFPSHIATVEKEKRPRWSKYETIDEFIEALREKANAWIFPNFNQALIEINAIHVPNDSGVSSSSDARSQAYIIVIKVTANLSNISQYVNDSKQYARLPKVVTLKDEHNKPLRDDNGHVIKIQKDYQSVAMGIDELTERMHTRYLHPSNLVPPIYYDSRPAVPELTSLFDFIYYGQVERFFSLLDRMPTLTQMTDSKGNNALIIASSYGNLGMIQCLVREYHMSIYQTNHDGESPLLKAIYANKIAFVQYYHSVDQHLIYHGDRLGKNAFLYACCYDNNGDMVRWLYSVKPSLIDTVDYYGRTALNIATQSNKNHAIEALLSLKPYTIDELRGALERIDMTRDNAEVCRQLLENEITQLEVSSVQTFGSPNRIGLVFSPPERSAEEQVFSASTSEHTL